MTTPAVTQVLHAALVHIPITIPMLPLDCCNGECDHGDYADCPEVDMAVCAACYALVGDYIDATSYPTAIFADQCPVCAAVVAWRAASAPTGPDVDDTEDDRWYRLHDGWVR
jgi:hypothetical protein